MNVVRPTRAMVLLVVRMLIGAPSTRRGCIYDPVLLEV